MNGVLIVDKPRGFTSFDVVALMRGLCHEKKIGHTGTLDPMATGVLPLLLGTATRALPLMEDTGKEYEAEFRLGFATDTQDTTGKITARSGKCVSKERVEEVLPRFCGEILQTPPMFSAVSVGGRRLYDLARQGIEVAREARPVTVSRLELLRFDEADQAGGLLIACSRGTYVRTLCNDIGNALGTYGVMSSLRRTKACGFSADGAVTVEQARELAAQGLLAQRLLPVECLFARKAGVTVTAAQAVRFANGGALDLARTSLREQGAGEGERFRVFSPGGEFLGLGEARGEQLRVLRVFRA